MQKTKIDWCTYVFNPVTGCLTGCKYCYAKKIAERFGGHKTPRESFFPNNDSVVLSNPLYITKKTGGVRICPFPYDFMPTLHLYRLEEPQHHKKPQRIFVCSMADLFGPWISDEWIVQVFDACKAAPQHQYMFLTKYPERYVDLREKGILTPEKNFWFGTTAETADSHIFGNPAFNCFVSHEPLMSDFPVVWPLHGISLVIIGAETGTRKDKVIPKKEWVDHISQTNSGISIFMKGSLLPIMGEENMLRQMPEGLKDERESNDGQS